MKFKSNNFSGEPKIYADPNSNSLICIMFNITADYCSYDCSVNQISFVDTFAFQQNTESFEVQNTSNVKLNLEWKLWMDERFPRRISSPVLAKRESQDIDVDTSITKVRSLKNLPQAVRDDGNKKKPCTNLMVLTFW